MSQTFLEGGNFGSVYKGILRDGKMGAIKTLNLQNEEAYKSFNTECKVLGKIRHCNLIRIISAFCFTGFKSLVLQFASNESLEKYLYPEIDDQDVCQLGSSECLSISIDVAHVMEYLQEWYGTRQPVHPSNISFQRLGHPKFSYQYLVIATSGFDESNFLGVGNYGSAYKGILRDGKMVAIKNLNLQNEEAHKSFNAECKVLVRIWHRNLIRIISAFFFTGFKDSQRTTFAFKGSTGYISPEYGLGGNVSIEGDVYSYGILTLEMVTRKRPSDDMYVGDMNLQKWVKSAFPNRLADIVDGGLFSDVNENMEDNRCLLSFIYVGLLCTSESTRE
ncbi:hypothetical protein SUGI_0311170 [Cryptomeria japonica]|nr:hypothetical protein SUGI_0311170 [Cryptomeria japonica]